MDAYEATQLELNSANESSESKDDHNILTGDEQKDFIFNLSRKFRAIRTSDLSVLASYDRIQDVAGNPRAVMLLYEAAVRGMYDAGMGLGARRCVDPLEAFVAAE